MKIGEKKTSETEAVRLPVLLSVLLASFQVGMNDKPLGLLSLRPRRPAELFGSPFRIDIRDLCYWNIARFT